MALPVNIDTLIHGRSIEWERLEFKKGWNPLDAMHTICAFANDFHNFGGGYIILGIEEKNGRPILPPTGITPSRIDTIQKELLNLGNSAIQPAYHPIVAPCRFKGRDIIIIWAPGGQTRPYKAKLAMGKDGREYGYFIRKGSSTVRAKGQDETELLSLAATVPFDDRMNQRASVGDLSRVLMSDFLKEVGSDLAGRAKKLTVVELGRQMHIVGGLKEASFPLNIGILFFNREPHRFFPGTQIDVVWFPEGPGGDRFTEKTFQGPLPLMIRETLDYIRRNYLNETVIKHPDKAEATRVSNFPYEAIEEAVVNAVYHRSYEEQEPIEVRISPQEIVVLSYPGPDRSVRLDQLRLGRAIPRRYRNRRIGEFLKELDLTEGRATGIPKILRSMKENSSPPPEFEFDEDHSYFMVRLPVNPQAEEITAIGRPESGVESGVESGAESEMVIAILDHLQGGVLGKKDLAERLGKARPTGYLNDLVRKMVSSVLIEFTIPEKPNSRMQKYRITEKGRYLLKRAWSGVETKAESKAETGAESEMVIVILDHLQGGVLGKKDLAERLGKARPTGYLNDLVRKMVSSGLIEFTIPEKSNSRMQKYRITEKGHSLLKIQGRIRGK